MSGVYAIVLNYHGSRKTESCLGSLTGQSIDAIYLVDNSVSAQEADSLNSVINSLKPDDNNAPIHLLVNDVNLGFARGVNTAIRVIRKDNENCQYYLLINNDTVVEPGTVARLLDCLESQKDIAIASPRVRSKDGDSCYRWYNKWTGLQTGRPMPGSFPFVSGSCMLVRADVVTGESLFDESFFMYGEDVLLAWQVQKNNRKVKCLQDALVYHEGTGSSAQGDLFYEYHVARGHVLLARKLAKNIMEQILGFLGRVIFLSLRGLVRSIRFRKTAPLLAAILAWSRIDILPDGDPVVRRYP
jgi:N-acetylglucosaminyl-diphospho-decaprenol L-rhamnosyltransferase